MQAQSTPSAYEAFFAAQKQFKSAIKDSANPFFKSKYADLASVWAAVSDALHDNGLFVTQPVQVSDAGHALVETVVRYKDGTEIERSQCPVISKQANDPQAMGSAITYARRYSLASILCVITDDDDGEAAMGQRNQSAKTEKADTRPVVNNKPASDLTDWQLATAACTDAADLNRTKKDIASAKLGDEDFKQVWGMLSARSKALGCQYSKEAKTFSQA